MDAFSKKASVVYVGTQKKAAKVVEAMKKVLQILGNPQTVFSDDGSEFTGSPFQKLMTERKIEHRFTQLHAAMVESFHRTLKMKLNSYLQSIGKDQSIKAILSAIPDILKNYNNTEHSTTKFKPNEVHQHKHEGQTQANIIARSNVQARNEVSIGDRVRVASKHKAFAKGHRPKWSKRTYEVVGKDGVYYVIDPDGSTETLRGDRKYLRSHIQLVKGDIQTNPSKEKIQQAVQVFDSSNNGGQVKDDDSDLFKEKQTRRRTRIIRKPARFRGAIS